MCDCRSTPFDSQATDKLREIAALVRCVKYLIEWIPNCSVGSSGYLRRIAVEKELDKFAEDGSLKQAVGVKADFEHPAQAIQGAKSANELREIAEQLGRKLYDDLCGEDDWEAPTKTITDVLERAMRLRDQAWRCFPGIDPADISDEKLNEVTVELLKAEAHK